ncbi:MAG: protein CrdC [Myxococcaceae bacterium]|nr:protein CrdC [Myxococcaceae bacterium]
MHGLRVSGTLLCHAGTHRIAFPAVDVAVIDAPGLHAGRSRSARQAFGEPAGASRVLLAPSGETVGVDTLEIDAEVHRVLPASPVVKWMGGGSLLGFIFVRGVLWPLVRLVEFEHFLAGAPREAA